MFSTFRPGLAFLLFALLLGGQPVRAASIYDKELPYKVRFGQATDVEILLEKGADPNQMNESGMPLVAVAASRTDGLAVPILRALIKAKANVNDGGFSKQYPIIIAARRGDAELMSFLLNEAYADFNVQDPNGAFPRDIAEHNGYLDLVAMIDAIQDERAKTLQDMYSPERRNQLIRELLFSSCGHNYMHYYFSTKQDDIPKEKQAEALELYKGRMVAALNDLQQIFQMDQTALLSLATDASKRIFNELEALISNRNRRKHGVGKPEDLEKRCGLIADAVMKERLRLPTPEGDATPQ